MSTANDLFDDGRYLKILFYYRKGDIMADASAESGKNTKIKLSKRDYTNHTKKKMMKYYNDPEKQTKLQERIKEYKEMAEKYILKAQELEQYVWTQNETHGEKGLELPE